MNKVGIIIAIENYIKSAVGLPKVSYAKNDAVAVKKLFVEKFGILEKDIIEFVDENATFINCGNNGELAYFMTRFPDDTTVYLYYAGHGFFSEGDNYLTVYDTSTLDLTETSISFNSVFMELFRKSKARRLVAFIDACAESMARNCRSVISRGFDFSGFETKESFDYALFFACSPNEKSMSSDDLGHGIWTYYLSKAFEDDTVEAFAENGDITAESLKEYLQNKVTEYVEKHCSNKKQIPYAIIACPGLKKAVNSFNFSVDQTVG